MFCPKCNVKVNANAKVCPLCHGTVIAEDSDAVQNAPRYFPKYDRHTPLYNPIYDKSYLIFAFIASIAAIVLNLVLVPDVIWWPLTIVLLFYSYFLIRNTLLDAKNFSVKFLFQLFLVTLLLAGAQILIYPNIIIAAYIVPALHVAADVVMVVYLLKMWRYPRQYVMPLLSVAIISATPVFFLLAFGVSDWQYALVCAAIGLIIFIASAIAYRKLLVRELIRFFHI